MEILRWTTTFAIAVGGEKRFPSTILLFFDSSVRSSFRLYVQMSFSNKEKPPNLLKYEYLNAEKGFVIYRFIPRRIVLPIWACSHYF